MAMSAGNSHYDYFPTTDFVQIWNGTEERSKEFERRIEQLFPCPTCKRAKTDSFFCSNPFHM